MRIVSHSFASAFLLYALSLGSSVATLVRADYGNPCTTDWVGPNRDNDFSCGVDDIVPWLTDNGLYGLAVPLAIGVLMFIPGCCCILVSRYACKCCGSANLRPGHVCCGGSELDMRAEGDLIRMYSKVGIFITKALAYACGVLGVVAVVLCLVGGFKVATGADDVPNAVFSLADWAIDLVTRVKDGVRDPLTGEYPTGFNLGDFDSIMSDVERIRGDAMNDYIDPYKKWVKLGATIPAYVSILPALFLLLPMIGAFCNFRRGLPIYVIVVSFPFQFLYLAIGSLLLILLVPVHVACDDINAGPAQRSITQWLLIPECEASAPFQDIKDNVNTMETDAAHEGCAHMLSICSATAAYSAADPSKMFYCAGLADATADCPTLERLQAVMGSMVLKSGAPEACGGLSASQCTVVKCAGQCDGATLKQQSADAVSALNTALRVRGTYLEVLAPWMDCTVLFDKLRTSGPQQACEMLQGGLGLIARGVLVMGFGLLLAIIVCLLGQKRFVNQSAYRLFADTDSHVAGMGVSAVGLPLQPMYQLSPVAGLVLPHSSSSYHPIPTTTSVVGGNGTHYLPMMDTEMGAVLPINGDHNAYRSVQVSAAAAPSPSASAYTNGVNQIPLETTTTTIVNRNVVRTLKKKKQPGSAKAQGGGSGNVNASASADDLGLDIVDESVPIIPPPPPAPPAAALAPAQGEGNEDGFVDDAVDGGGADFDYDAVSKDI